MNTEDVEFAQKVLEYQQRQRGRRKGNSKSHMNEMRLMRLGYKLSMELALPNNEDGSIGMKH
ncbi:hypothetical protein [Nostoc sp.]|uniref:hypothetical protein n=1 Tax=Nostoc sp. TaxID=1180 RepID=UPI002FF88AD1